MSCSDVNSTFRQFMMQNCFGREPTHFFGSLEDQTNCQACCLHPYAAAGCQAAPVEPDLAISGSPCHPFSTMRAKRFSDGSVAAHPEYAVTARQLLDWYQKFEPRCMIAEQVLGFDMKMDAQDTKSPLNRCDGCE